jgi:hypothetical protein
VAYLPPPTENEKDQYLKYLGQINRDDGPSTHQKNVKLNEIRLKIKGSNYQQITDIDYDR